MDSMNLQLTHAFWSDLKERMFGQLCRNKGMQVFRNMHSFFTSGFRRKICIPLKKICSLKAKKRHTFFQNVPIDVCQHFLNDRAFTLKICVCVDNRHCFLINCQIGYSTKMKKSSRNEKKMFFLQRNIRQLQLCLENFPSITTCCNC